MNSVNFEFLRPDWPELAELAGFAESYAHADPVGAIGKLRSFCEHFAKAVHHDLRLPRTPKPDIFDLLNDATFQQVVPRVVVSKLHILRKEGNRAVHGNEGDATAALRLLKDAHDAARWMYLAHADGRIEDCPEFTEPPEGGADGLARRREKRSILERVAAQEAQVQKLLEQLDESRARAEQAAATVAELETAADAGRQSVEALERVDPAAFNEAEVRRYFIDTLLVEAGWDVGPDLESTAEVGKEITVPHQPTDSETGKADYILHDDDGSALAVVEAKKTSIDPEAGRTQAQLYADGLEREHGRRPVIFYTNGRDL